jgi:hypothetical protein
LHEERGDKRLAGIFSGQANLFRKQTSPSVPLKPKKAVDSNAEFIVQFCITGQLAETLFERPGFGSPQ